MRLRSVRKTRPSSSDANGDDIRDSAPESRNAILFHTAALLAKKGYAATTMRGIASAVGMKPGSLYHHFSSKDEILDEVARLGLTILTNSFNDAMDRLPADATGRDAIEAGIRSLLGTILNTDPNVSTYIWLYSQLPPIMKKRVRRERRVYGSLWVNLIHQATRDGSITPGQDPYLLAAFVLGSLNRVMEWYNPTVMKASDVTEFVVARLLYGIAMPPSGIQLAKKGK